MSRSNNNFLFYLVWLSVVATIIFLVCSSFIGIERSLGRHTISTEHQQKIIDQIGYRSFQNIKIVNCDEAIAYYIAKDVWIDLWCRDKYQRIDFNID